MSCYYFFFILHFSDGPEFLQEVIFQDCFLILIDMHRRVVMVGKLGAWLEEGVGLRDKMESQSVFYKKYILAQYIGYIWKLQLKKTRKKSLNSLNFMVTYAFRDIDEEKLLK